jgi:tRNA threonylcarbamoyladenosine biosynthesis protein TsaE
MKKQLTTYSAEQTIQLGQQLGQQAFSGAIITLKGDLGSGKTTLAKGVALGLGITKPITSPSYTIMKTYEGRLKLIHIDAYRLSGIGLDYDIEEAIYGDGVSVIEWSTNIQTSIDHECSLTLERVGDTCSIEIEYDERYQSLVEEL